MKLHDIGYEHKPTVQTGLKGKYRAINRASACVYTNTVTLSFWGEEGSPTFIELKRSDAEQLARLILEHPSAEGQGE